ncbi:hypothetical protein OSTOST_09623 [Ostertagia ostertagi]
MSVADLVGFEECLLNAAFAYTRPRREYANGLGEEQTLIERIFGIYATFILYYAQPIDYVSKIHVTPEDCDSLMQLSENTLIPAGHVDAYACLQRLIVDDAFRIVMSSKNHDLSNHRRYERPNPVEMLLDEQERHVPLESASGIMKHPVLKAMKYVEQKMEQKERSLFNRRMPNNDTSSFLDKLQNIYSAHSVHELYKVESGTEEDAVDRWKDSSSTSFCKKPESSTAKAIQNRKVRQTEICSLEDKGLVNSALESWDEERRI